ncbi:hypothetical protein ACVWZ4_002860 [Bradyrhizobium sp. USDA 4472]
MTTENDIPQDADLIGGGDRIAQFLFGRADEQLRREVYHLAEHHALPVFKVGNKIYARRTKLTEWIKSREAGVEPPPR